MWRIDPRFIFCSSSQIHLLLLIPDSSSAPHPRFIFCSSSQIHLPYLHAPTHLRSTSVCMRSVSCRGESFKALNVLHSLHDTPLNTYAPFVRCLYLCVEQCSH